MIHAHCDGVDIGGDTRDPLWWKKLAIVNDHVARKLRYRLLAHKYDFNLALLTYETEASTFKLHHQQAEFLRNSITEELLPWIDTGPKTLRESLAHMRQEYNRRFADPTGEKGRAAIADQLRIWKEKQRGHGRSKLSKRQLYGQSAI